jgi:hypothetical protein
LTSSPVPPDGEIARAVEPRSSLPPPSGPPRISGRNLLLVIVPALVVLITFLFWYQTWFGRPLSDAEMAQYLADTAAPHKIQHAVAQLGERMAHGDPTAHRWYPQLLAMAHNKQPQLRLMAAWAMGQDNHSQEFQKALRELLADPEVLVRWNAALALVRFGDAAGEPQLLEMLRPLPVVARQAGTLHFKVKELAGVREGGVVASLETGQGTKPREILSPIAGQLAELLVKDGAQVAAGEAVAVVAPGESSVWESLRALYLVGQPQDLKDVERYTGDVPGMSERVRQQAALTAAAIRRRAAHGKG